MVYDWVSWFVRMRWFDYLGMAFLLLRWGGQTLVHWFLWTHWFESVCP